MYVHVATIFTSVKCWGIYYLIINVTIVKHVHYMALKDNVYNLKFEFTVTLIRVAVDCSR